MKTLLAMALLVSSVSAFSASVKVTSFNYVRIGSDSYPNPMAELCGLVTGATKAPSFINVQVDPKSNNPASYNTLAGADGKFCIALITYRGTAEVSLIGENAKTTASIK